MKTALVLAGVLLASGAGTVAAQTLVRIEAERNYRLTYTDLLGQTHTVTVEPSDKINPVVEADVTLTPEGARYEYSIWNLAEPLPSFDIASLRVPCDPDGLRNSEERLVLGHLDSPVCVFVTFDDLLYPGGFAEGYTIESVALPALATLRLSGLNPPVPWPSEEGTVPDQALELARSVRVGVNGWAAVPGIAPLRMPNEIGDPESFLGVIASDLGQVCDLGWITNQGVCNSLDAKLRAAAQSLDGGRLAAARGSLRAFLQELEAQHGDEPGKHVDANAYALLRVNVEYLLSILPLPPSPPP